VCRSNVPIERFRGVQRGHVCQWFPTPMHQPGPPHASADGAPRPNPVSCSPDTTASPQRKATTQHCPAAPTPGLGGRTTRRGRTSTLILPTTCAAHTLPAICWRRWRAGRTQEFRRRGHLYQSRCHCRLAPPAPAKAIYIVK
jgi:hypothetical protein